MNYTLAGGFCGAANQKPGQVYDESFFQTWYFNTKQTANPPPKAIVVIDHDSPVKPDPKDCVWLPMTYNLGYVGALMDGTRKHDLTGWSGAFLLGALYAYVNGTDYIFKEEDCLCFGPWVEALYDACKDKGMTFGSNKIMGIAQSLVLVKHAFIPTMVGTYLKCGDDLTTMTEHKFAEIERRYPSAVCRYTFGYDRDRPFHAADPVFHVQQLTPDELTFLRNSRLLPRKIQFGCGTNHLNGWENYDAEVDITKKLPFPDNCASHIFIEHCVEHVTVHEAYAFFEECQRVLIHHGTLRVAIPDTTRIWREMNLKYVGFVHSRGWGEPTRKGGLHHIIHRHGHQHAWSGEVMEAVLQSIGFSTSSHRPGKSNDPVLCGAEGHGRVIGEDINDIETVCIEAVK